MSTQDERCIECKDNNQLIDLIRSQAHLKIVRTIELVTVPGTFVGALIAQSSDFPIWISLSQLITCLVLEAFFRISRQIFGINRVFLSLDKEERLHLHSYEPLLAPNAVPCRFWKESTRRDARVVERSYTGAMIEIKASLWWNLRCRIHAHSGNSWKAQIRGRKLLLYDIQSRCLSIRLTKEEVTSSDESLITKEVRSDHEIKWALGTINNASSILDLQPPQTDQEKPAVVGLIGQA